MKITFFLWVLSQIKFNIFFVLEMPPAGQLYVLQQCFSDKSLHYMQQNIEVFLCFSCRSALQVLHKACELSRRFNYFPGGIALTWMAFYESCITSEQSFINEWNAMTDLETTRSESPNVFVDRWVFQMLYMLQGSALNS